MNIEEFYDADERRRDSQELELGDRWLDADGLRHTLNYVVDTRELYFMAAPEPDVVEDAFGDIAVDDEAVEELTVDVFALVPSVDELHAALAGWESVVGEPDSARWARDHVALYPPK
jgi:hypothetical protein